MCVSELLLQHSVWARFKVGFLAVLVTLGLVSVAWLPMTWQQQIVFGSVIVLAGILAKHFLHAQRVTYFLVLMSLCATLRYGVWRAVTL
jgi:hypothetical protein